MGANTSNPSGSNSFQALIDSVRREAVKAAEEEVNRIHTNAKERAARLLADAKLEAEQIVADARNEAKQFETSSEDAIRRASRDMILELESALLTQLEAVYEREARAVLTGDSLPEIVQSLIENWSQDQPNEPIEVLVNRTDLEKLEEIGLQGLRDDLKSGVSLQSFEGIEAGVRIGTADGAAHYDFSPRTLARWMSRFAGPRLGRILREAVGKATNQKID